MVARGAAGEPLNGSGHGGDIVFFDGVCSLCNRAVDFLVRRDRRGRYRFAPLQGETARAVVPGDVPAEGGDPRSIVLWRGGRAHRQSGAAIRIAGGLGGVWALAYAALVVPWPLRDWVYGVVAVRRYRWFGKRETCRLPTPEERARFLP